MCTWSLTVQPDCLKGRLVCGTVYGDMHLKDLLGSITRVGYCIPVLDFYLVLHGLCCRKSTIMSDREPTRWQHNRIYPHPINPCMYTYDSCLYCSETVDAHCSNIIKS